MEYWEVVKAFTDGKKIERRDVNYYYDSDQMANWEDHLDRSFDFNAYEYRIKQEPLCLYVAVHDGTVIPCSGDTAASKCEEYMEGRFGDKISYTIVKMKQVAIVRGG